MENSLDDSIKMQKEAVMELGHQEPSGIKNERSPATVQQGFDDFNIDEWWFLYTLLSHLCTIFDYNDDMDVGCARGGGTGHQQGSACTGEGGVVSKDSGDLPRVELNLHLPQRKLTADRRNPCMLQQHTSNYQDKQLIHSTDLYVVRCTRGTVQLSHLYHVWFGQVEADCLYAGWEVSVADVGFCCVGWGM